MAEQWFDIFQAAQELDLTEGYVRLMVRQGVIATKKVPVREGSSVMKHVISKKELYAFSQREGAKSPRRRDGRNKHCFYSTDEELLRVKELLYATHDPGLMVVAESIVVKEITNDHYIPPSKQQAAARGTDGKQRNPEAGSGDAGREGSDLFVRRTG